MPKFSIVVPCYNARATLPATLAALKDQTIEDWEAILVDDGSRDGTQDFIRDMSEADPRFRIVLQENAGPSVARNRGVGLARAKWVAFLDADDLWLPGKLGSIADLIADKDAPDAVFGGVDFFCGDEMQVTASSREWAGLVTIEDVLGENPTCTLSNLTIRKSAFLSLGGFNSDLRHSEDLEFLMRLVVGGYRLQGMPESHVLYRTSIGGLSADLEAMHEGWRSAVASVASEVSASDRARAEARHLRYLARRALRIDTPPTTALSFAMRGVSVAPRAFLADGHRGLATLAGCLSAPLLPAPLRRRVFA